MIFPKFTLYMLPGGEAEMIFHNEKIKVRPESEAR